MSETIDLQAMDQLKELMGDKFATLVETYLRNAEVYVSNIVNGFAQEDYEMIVSAAHTLKSSSGNLCLNTLSQRSESIEQTAKALVQGEGNKEELAALVDGFEALFGESKKLLEDQL